MKFWMNWDRRKTDLNAELEAHLRLAMEERIANGESPEEARAAALREMGNPPLVADVTRASWGWQWLERMAQDLRYAIRQLAKSPGYTLTALLTLTLAIGANTAIFGLMYALLLRSLPVKQPERIVQIQMQLVGKGGHREEPSASISIQAHDSLAGKQQVFDSMCAWDESQIALHDATGTRPVPVAAVTGDCFGMLGIRPETGRLLTEADDKPGGAPEGFPVVLGYDYWRSHLGADPHVLGRVLSFGASMGAKPAKGVVVGVMQPGFDSVQIGSQPWMYVPMEMVDPESDRSWGSFNNTVLGRLKDGVTPQQAQAQADGIFNAALKAQKDFPYYVFGETGLSKASEAHLLVTPGRTGYSYMRSYYEKPLYLVEGMVGLSLLVACAYLAMLSSARALTRRRELAIRIALGASRRRVASQLWYENVLLALVGSGLGVLFAWSAEHVLVAMMKFGEENNPIVLQAGPGSVVLLFTLGLTVFTVLVSGVLPAWRGSRVDPAHDIKEGDTRQGGRRRGRIGALLIPVEIGFSLVIVVLAVLMGSTVARLLAVDPGFRTSGVTFMNADFSSRWRSGKDKDFGVPPALFMALLDRIRNTPGVENVSMSQAYPLSRGRYLRQVSTTAIEGGIREDNMMTDLSVTPEYFATLGIPILAGRSFTKDDKEDAPQVCILNRAAADYFFPNGNAVGAMLNTAKDIKAQVIGVVGDTLYGDLREKKPLRILYTAYLSGETWNPDAKVAVRSRDTATAVAAVRNAFRDIAPDVAVAAPITMSDLVQGSMGRERLVALLAGFFAVLTLTLTCIGLYGVLNYSVVRRKREIGVRMALGASRGKVVGLVVREALWMVVPGLVLGAVGAWAATRFVQSLLFGVKPLDPWVLAASAAVLLATAIAACLLPARRAATVHPMEALRIE